MAQLKKRFTPISPLILRPDFRGEFEIFLNHEAHYVLFNGKGRKLSGNKRQELVDNNVRVVYIAERDVEHYRSYLTKNIRSLLEDESVPLEDRAKAWTNSTIALGRELFERNLPGPAFSKRYARFVQLIENSSGFLHSPDSLHELSRFIGKGNEAYHHGISTMVYTINLLQEYGAGDYDTLAAGMGALLHDMGKTGLPHEVTQTPPEALSDDDRDILRLHPMLGVRACSNFNLPVVASNCILFHHERADGRGYPTMATSDDLPVEVKAVALCNVYDNLTRTLPYRRALSPFDALKRIMDDRGLAEPDMLKRLVKLLSRAKIVTSAGP